MTAIRKQLKNFVAVVILFLIAAGTSVYILTQERLRIPFLQPQRFAMKAELATAQGVTPGQGQTVNVAGVSIGEIVGVTLKDGHALLNLEIDPDYKQLIHQDAQALLRPRTGLKDMFLEIDPGGHKPVASAGWTIPVSNTMPDVNLDEILAALDADTRPYLRLLLADGANGLNGRGGDLREVFRRFEPTHRDLARVSTAVAGRRADLAQLVNSLKELNTALAGRGRDLSQLVVSSSAVFRAFASENQNLSRTVADLPSTLRQTTTTLGKVESFAKVLGPTADALRPSVRAITAANIAIRPFARETTPILKNQIRPFVREVRPLVRDLRPAALNLAAATPDLTRSFVVLNHLFNMLAFNRGKGPNEGPFAFGAPARSYLFWVAWVTHQTENLFSLADANGTLRPTTLGGTCDALRSLVSSQPAAQGLLGLTPLFKSPAGCGPGSSGTPGLAQPAIPGSSLPILKR